MLCGIPSNVTNGYVRFVIDGSPVDVRIASPCTSDGVDWLVNGIHLIKVRLVDIPNRSVPTSYRIVSGFYNADGEVSPLEVYTGGCLHDHGTF